MGGALLLEVWILSPLGACLSCLLHSYPMGILIGYHMKFQVCTCVLLGPHRDILAQAEALLAVTGLRAFKAHAQCYVAFLPDHCL